jgi:transposase-like protein
MSWKRNWDELATFFKYPDALRGRKTVKGKSVFPTKIALFKALYLAVTEASKRWTVRTRNWSEIYLWNEARFPLLPTANIEAVS